MFFDIFDHAKQDESARQRGNGKVLESATFEFENHIGAKMVDVWNVNKLTKANEVGENVKKTNHCHLEVALALRQLNPIHKKGP